MYPKRDDLHRMIFDTYSELIVLTETGLTFCISDSEIFPLHDFDVLPCDRASGCGGGLSIDAKHSLSCTNIPILISLEML